jgi:hypothetical protein
MVMDAEARAVDVLQCRMSIDMSHVLTNYNRCDGIIMSNCTFKKLKSALLVAVQ